MKKGPRDWFERLTNFLLKKGSKGGGVDKTILVKKTKQHVLIAPIYIDDIVFRPNSKELTDEFVSCNLNLK